MSKPFTPSLLAIPLLRGKPVAGYILALGAFGIAFWIRWAIDDELPTGFPFLTFFPAVGVACLVSGTMPAILVAVLSLLAAWYAFIPPAFGFNLDLPTLIALGLFAFVTGVEIALVHAIGGALAHLRAERVRSQQLADIRERLMRELQHRISNNLQLVSGLMRMQRTRVSDPEARKVLEEAANRLVLIGRLNRQLHDPSGEAVRFDEFLKGLCADIVDASGVAGVECAVRSEPVALGPDRSIPLALAVSELLGNALAHGMAGRPGGAIVVTLDVQADGWLALAVGDDGPGLPEGFDPRTSGSLGLRVVRALAAQIDGEFTLFDQGGAVGRIAFPMVD